MPTRERVCAGRKRKAVREFGGANLGMGGFGPCVRVCVCVSRCILRAGASLGARVIVCIFCVCMLVCTKGDISFPSGEEERAQGWGGERWLHATCFYFLLERGAF